MYLLFTKIFSNTNGSTVDGAFDEDRLSLPRVDLSGSQVEDVFSAFFILAGVIAVIMIIVGGYTYVLSGGDPQKTKKAKDTILYALIGLVVSISAWAIVGFVLGRV